MRLKHLVTGTGCSADIKIMGFMSGRFQPSCSWRHVPVCGLRASHPSGTLCFFFAREHLGLILRPVVMEGPILSLLQRAIPCVPSSQSLPKATGAQEAAQTSFGPGQTCLGRSAGPNIRAQASKSESQHRAGRGGTVCSAGIYSHESRLLGRGVKATSPSLPTVAGGCWVCSYEDM